MTTKLALVVLTVLSQQSSQDGAGPSLFPRYLESVRAVLYSLDQTVGVFSLITR